MFLLYRISKYGMEIANDDEAKRFWNQITRGPSLGLLGAFV